MKKHVLICLISIIFLGVFVSCKLQYAVPYPNNFTEEYLLSGVEDFSIEGMTPNNYARNWYFGGYLSVIPDVTMYTGIYPSRGELLAAHMLEGESTSQGTAIFIHGYDGNSLYTNFQYFAQQFIKDGFRVVLLDLPGHAFSGGLRGSMDSFIKYGEMIRDFLKVTEGQLGKNIVMIGQSTGAIALYDMYIHYSKMMEQVTVSVFLSPFYEVKNTFFLSVGSHFVDSVVSRANPRPLQLYRLPSSWIDSQNRWRKGADKYRVLPKNFLVLYGENDKVIHLKKSMEFYQSKLPNAEFRFYTNQDHNFISEGYKEVREETYSWIKSQLALSQ